MTQFHIVGIDQSLSATGIARIRPGDPVPVRVDLVKSSPVPNATYLDTLKRVRSLIARIIRKAREGADEGDILIFAMEGPAYGMSGDQRGHHVRAGLFWLLYHLLEKIGLVVIVSPSSLKRYATRKGNAPKDAVLAAVVRNFPAVDVTDNNEADAIVLASMVARELGFPQEPSVQRVDPAALESIDWPEFITQRRTA